mmetsp:Transcript_13783/g.29038  ORF Transcript_13783/g.29038 Transcript_13783/m.29038 type:complete len:457 (+) Transcript_13783:107-1477(+)|eukprot:CAMPEP_0201120274 /NCGR_PEP_ID=MMETSP0850-20130426/4353_1 /ASSEMBLY_ACC=CAM_ASM_000622 /TAXON_ID=183588 /ORGANISM="Pseudo-nitzschia fraudulenta, Strain WWA7" /LENGTH=456 /DNA_ID=CAMNT_0047386353 /DNA_START=170 /DNA_END=1540 /DNA_ORIENTATION=+
MNERVAGISLVGVVCASQVLSALTSQIAVHSLDAPFFLMWIHTLMMVLMWPLGLVLEAAAIPVAGGSWCCCRNGSRNPNNAVAPAVVDGDDGGVARKDRIALLVRDARHKLPGMIGWIVGLFYPLWVGANYCYVAALRHVPASTMVSVFGSCTAFVAVEERIWLRPSKPCTVTRVLAVVLAVGGVVAYGILGGSESGSGNSHPRGGDGDEDESNNNNNNNLLAGVFLGTCSSLAAATYKVAFKKVLGSPATTDVCLFLSLLGIVNGVVGVLPVLALAHLSIEQPFYEPGPGVVVSWGIVWGGSVLILVFNASIAFGIAVTSPLFIAVGTILAIPVTDAIDCYFVWIQPSTTNEEHGAFAGTGQVAASLAIVASFVLIVFFDAQQHEEQGDSTMERVTEPGGGGAEASVLVGNSTDEEEGLLPSIAIIGAREAITVVLVSGHDTMREEKHFLTTGAN